MTADLLQIVPPDLENFKEQGDVNVQPVPSPRPCPTYEILTPLNLPEKEEDRILLHDLELLQDVRLAPSLPSSPQSCPPFEPTVEEKEKHEEEDIVFLQSEPRSEVVPVTEQPERDVLDSLVPVERINITRKLHIKNAFIMSGQKNTFYIRTPDKKLLYTIEEEHRWCVRYCLYGLQPLVLKVRDREGLEVIRVTRPYAITTRILPCALQSMQVFSPPDRRIGSIMQRWTPITPHYVIKDFYGQILFEIHGPRITISCFHDMSFHVKRPDGTLVATASKRWEGLFHAFFISPVVDRFNLSFVEKSLETDEKALLMATALLLDYMYFD